jgi:hypothetical protein
LGEGIKEERGNGIMFEWFRDEYCSHQSAYHSFGKDEPAVAACLYKDGKPAAGFADWQKCTKENCPFIKRIEGELHG